MSLRIKVLKQKTILNLTCYGYVSFENIFLLKNLLFMFFALNISKNRIISIGIEYVLPRPAMLEDMIGCFSNMAGLGHDITRSDWLRLTTSPTHSIPILVLNLKS